MKPAIIGVFILLLLTPNYGMSQDSTDVKKDYASYGLQASFVSGMGISYGRVFDQRTRTRITGGILTTQNTTQFSVGGDLQFFLTRGNEFNVFVGPSVGSFGETGTTPKPRIAFSTGFERPVTGKTIYNNISAGVVLYYPTYYIQSNTIGVAAGVFIYYNY